MKEISWQTVGVLIAGIAIGAFLIGIGISIGYSVLLDGIEISAS